MSVIKNAEGEIWLFYDRLEKKKKKPFKHDAAQMFILSLRIKDIKNYAIWTPGWSEWKLLPDFLTSQQNFFVTPPNLNVKPLEKEPIIPEHTLTITSTRAPFTEVTFERPKEKEWVPGQMDFSAEEIHTNPAFVPIAIKPGVVEHIRVDNRNKTRHEFKLEIVLMTHQGSFFRSYSKNISLSGTLLYDPLPPKFLHQNFNLIVINPLESDSARNRIIFQGRVVGDLTDARRLSFVTPNEESLFHLELLLKNYVKSQNKKRATA